MARYQVFRFGTLAAVAAGAILTVSPMAHAQGVLDNWAAVKAPPKPQLKTVKLDPQKTALLVMDFNQGLCTPKMVARCEAAIPHVKALIDKAKAAHVLTIYTGYPHMKPFVTAIAPPAGAPMVIGHADKFPGTNLGQMLKSHGITTVVATGIVANGAVLFTSFGAASQGYKVVVPVDAMPGPSAYAEQSVIWGLMHDPGLGNATTLSSADRITF